ncbi:hypothetical protein FO519_003489 [Halicephalobus sp. NKZ332]|nr:hypothetical protein FO519_003489 [Halicephalobus sp. NKZ332]
MPDYTIVCDAIRNNTLIKDIEGFSKEQLEPFLPYLWSLTCISGRQSSSDLDKIRSRYIDFAVGNQFEKYFQFDPVPIEKELSSFREQPSFFLNNDVHFSNMSEKEKFLYIGKQLLIIMNAQGINSKEFRTFEPFDQEVYHEEVVFIITLLCHFFPLLFSVNRFNCYLLSYKYGPELITKIVMNQLSTYDSVLLQFLDLKMFSTTNVGLKRDTAIFSLLFLDRHAAPVYLPMIIASDVHFNLAINLLCSDLISDELFVSVLISHFTKNNDKFIQQLSKSQREELFKLDGRIKKIAQKQSSKMNDLSSRLIILMTIRYVHRSCCTHVEGATDVLRFISTRDITAEGYLSTITSAFITCFFVCMNSGPQHSLQKDVVEFFEKIKEVILKNKKSLSNFNEFILLAAIHLRTSGNLELMNLLSTTLGFDIPKGLGKNEKILKLSESVSKIIDNKLVAELASEIRVTPGLNNHVSGYLPAHCIDYLLSQRTFASQNVSISEWIQNQIVECQTPVHPIIVSVLRKYANSCIPCPETGVCNQKLSEFFFLKLFEKDVYTQNNLAPYLLSLYFICAFNAVGNRCNFRSEHLYRSNLLDRIPIRYLVGVMDDHSELYTSLRPQLLALVADYLAPHIGKLDENLRKQKIDNFHQSPIKNLPGLPTVDEAIGAAKMIGKAETKKFENFLKIVEKIPPVQKLFLLMPELIDLLHSQGYPVKDIPMMIEHVEACHIVGMKIPDLMKLANLKKRIFFIIFVAHLFKKFRLPVFAGYAQMMKLYVKEQIQMSHTILLIQSTDSVESRTWTDYETTVDCLEAICKIYEEHLKKLNPVGSVISYEADDLIKFLDRLTDISCLIFSHKSCSYLPRSREWIKREIYNLLREQLHGNGTD